MEKGRLDKELETIYKAFTFLWERYYFHISYFTRDYGIYNKGFIIGLENNVCKLVFEKETNSPTESIAVNIGKKNSPFAPLDYSYLIKDGWYSLPGLIYWLSGVECERDQNAEQDLENISQHLKMNIEKLLDLFGSAEQFDSKIQYYRDFYKEKRITVEKIRDERARLEALGQDSSLEAAITSLRGGKNE